MQLAVTHADRVTAAMAPITVMLRELLEDAVAAKEIASDDIRRTASLIEQTVMYSWFGNRLVHDPAHAGDGRGHLGVLPARPQAVGAERVLSSGGTVPLL